MTEREWSVIATALLKSQEAVQADHAGLYDKAVSIYKEAILLLDAHVLVALSEDHREKLMEIVRQNNKKEKRKKKKIKKKNTKHKTQNKK